MTAAPAAYGPAGSALYVTSSVLANTRRRPTTPHPCTPPGHRRSGRRHRSSHDAPANSTSNVAVVSSTSTQSPSDPTRNHQPTPPSPSPSPPPVPSPRSSGSIEYVIPAGPRRQRHRRRHHHPTRARRLLHRRGHHRTHRGAHAHHQRRPPTWPSSVPPTPNRPAVSPQPTPAASSVAVTVTVSTRPIRPLRIGAVGHPVSVRQHQRRRRQHPIRTHRLVTVGAAGVTASHDAPANSMINVAVVASHPVQSPSGPHSKPSANTAVTVTVTALGAITQILRIHRVRDPLRLRRQRHRRRHHHPTRARRLLHHRSTRTHRQCTHTSSNMTSNVAVVASTVHPAARQDHPNRHQPDRASPSRSPSDPPRTAPPARRCSVTPSVSANTNDGADNTPSAHTASSPSAAAGVTASHDAPANSMINVAVVASTPTQSPSRLTPLETIGQHRRHRHRHLRLGAITQILPDPSNT